MSSLVERIKAAREQKNEIHEYRLREKEILLEENRNIIKELKLIDLIIKHFIPQNEVKKLESKLSFSEEVDDWTIKDMIHEDMVLERPGSIFNFKRPLCEHSRMAVNFGD